MIYSLVLFLHNLTRWAVLLTAIWALVMMYRGWFGRTPWTDADSRASRIFMGVLDLQFLLGIILYVLSPLIRAAMQDFGAAMGTTELRFFAVEHVTMMLIAVVLAHVGTVLARRASDSVAKHRNAALLYTLSTLIILVAIPWWRPLLRGIMSAAS